MLPWAFDGKLRRSADGILETALVGVEYYSQDQHGGRYGTVYRQYFSGTLATLTNANMDDVASSVLFDLSSTGYASVVMAYYSTNFAASDLYTSGIILNNTSSFLSPAFVSANGVKGGWGSVFDGKPYTGWVDYTK